MVYTRINDVPASAIASFTAGVRSCDRRLEGVCGFDGFIDHFIKMVSPATMAEFGSKVTAAAGVAASYTSQHLGDKFGGNGPLFATALHGIRSGEIDVHYMGALGRDGVLPIYEEALRSRMKGIYSLADPAHSDCLEFVDGKIMLGDLRSCAEIDWERLLECVGAGEMDDLLRECDFVAAVNWGKLINVGTIWENIALRLGALGVPKKEVVFFMDLAEFEHRPQEDREELLALVATVTRQCETIISFNLKEAWQMADSFGGTYHGKKDPRHIADLAAFLRRHIDVDRVLIHPNDGAACASNDGAVYVPGPFCKEPLISTGAGDHFGAGALAAALHGLDDLGILLAGVTASGYFVRSGESPSFDGIVGLLDMWIGGRLPERLEAGAQLPNAIPC